MKLSDRFCGLTGLHLLLVQVVEQQNGPGQLPTFLYSFDEHQDMQPFVETESEDETETSAKLKTGMATSWMIHAAR